MAQNVRTLAQLFAHPTSHNLHWREVIQLFHSLGGTTEETKRDHIKVRLSGREMTFQGQHGSGSTLQSDHQIASIRRFIKECGFAPVDVTH